MQQNTRVADRYAHSLVELAAERGELPRVSEDMAAMARLCKESRDFRLFLRSPVVRGGDKKRVMDLILEKHFSKTSLAFVDLLIAKGREVHAEQIALRFLDRVAVLSDLQPAEVTTTVALNAAERKALEAQVKAISGRKNVELSERLDKELLGGYVLRVGDKQHDASLRTQLRKLREELSPN